jgi:hypothetical protein
MNCEDVQSLLVDFYDNRLEPITRNAIEDHLKICEACKKELDETSVLFESIADSNLEIPPASLRENFIVMLDQEVGNEKNKKEYHRSKIISGKQFSLIWKIAAAVIIFFGGTFLGMQWKNSKDNSSNTQVNELKSEIKDVKELMMFKLLQEESASDRIQAVNYVDEIANPDQKVIAALIRTLNYDKNVNVRLAALYSLAKFSENSTVMDSLISSLSRQTDAVIQIVMINMLASKKDSRARKPIEEILSDKKTLQEVKEIATKKLKAL